MEQAGCRQAGFFVPSVRLGSEVEEGSEIGMVFDISSGDIRETMYASHPGRIMALRVQPVVSLGTMVARILLHER